MAKTLKNANKTYDKITKEFDDQAETLVKFYTKEIDKATKEFGGKKALSRKLKKDESYITININRQSIRVLKAICDDIAILRSKEKEKADRKKQK